MSRRLLSFLLLFSLCSWSLPAYALIIPGYGLDSLKVRNPARKKIRVSVPVKPKSQFRNEKRKEDLKYFGNAFFNYRREHGDKNAPGVTRWEQEICRSDAKSCTGLVDVSAALKEYIDPIPRDPLTPAIGNGTRYFIKSDYKERVFIRALDAEDGWAINIMH